MGNGLSIAADVNRARVFQCPSCKQTIDSTASECRFCATPIDPISAEIAMNTMARMNQACSDASYLKIALVCGLAFIAVQFIPFMGLVGVVGVYFLILAIPFWTVRWWLKFWDIKADDLDFRRAKRTMVAFGIPVSILLLLYFANLVGGFFHPGAH